MKMETSTCPVCGQTFSYSASRPQTYCSRACRRSVIRVDTTCPQCGKAFWYYKAWPRKFCSHQCSTAANARRNLGIVECGPQACEVCGKDIRTVAGRTWHNRRFCSRDCFHIHQNRTEEYSGVNNRRWLGGPLPYYGVNWRQQRRNARHHDGYCCCRCGRTEEQNGKALDVHHIKSFREFGLDRFREANAVSNLVSLCASCHAQVHHSPNDHALLGH
ncbi:MAG TPA: hypothetical protein DCP69_04070 [Candidatus Omnitrophica bacterium]|nr:hypothetical protein [Candidatus Omnitrophota bacterium]